MLDGAAQVEVMVSTQDGAPRRRGRPPLPLATHPVGGEAQGAAGAAADEAGESGKDRQFVTALARGVMILQCFSVNRPELSGSQIAKITGLPQPTVWRLCHTLLELGMLTMVANERMRPGLAVLRLGYSALSGMSVIDLARPYMQELASKYGAACGIGVRDGLDMVFVERCEGQNQLLMNLRVGSTVPLATSALGWAFIAGHGPDGRARILNELTAQDEARFSTARACLEEALLDYGRTGFVLNIGVYHKAYNTVAVPLVMPDGTVPYVLNCGAPAASLSTSVLETQIAPQLANLARSLQKSLGPQADPPCGSR